MNNPNAYICKNLDFKQLMKSAKEFSHILYDERERETDIYEYRWGEGITALGTFRIDTSSEDRLSFIIENETKYSPVVGDRYLEPFPALMKRLKGQERDLIRLDDKESYQVKDVINAYEREMENQYVNVKNQSFDKQTGFNEPAAKGVSPISQSESGIVIYKNVKDVFPFPFQQSIQPNKELTSCFTKACGYYEVNPDLNYRLTIYHVFYALTERRKEAGLNQMFTDNSTGAYQREYRIFTAGRKPHPSYHLNLGLPQLSPSQQLEDILLSAISIAVSASSKRLSVYHLWKAILDSGDSEIMSLVAKVDIDMQQLYEKLESKIAVPDDEDMESSIDESPLIALTQTDVVDADTPDAIGMEDEAWAFARLFAYKDLKTPLSIAVFGYWGSGKSFFMKKLFKFVKELKDEAAVNNYLDESYPYYPHLVQIEFNAWHFMETNLWASLVDHIFSELDKYLDEEQKKSKEHRDMLFSRLTTVQELRQKTRGKIESIKVDIYIAREELAEKQRCLKEMQEEKANLEVKDIWRVVRDKFKDEIESEVGQDKTKETKLNKASKVLGISDLKTSGETFYNQWQELTKLFNRGKALSASLSNFSAGSWIILILLLVGLPLGWIIGGAYITNKYSIQLNQVAGSLASILATLSAFLGIALKSASSAIKTLEPYGRKIGELVKQEQEKDQKAIIETNDRLKEFEIKFKELNEHLGSLEKQDKILRHELEGTKPRQMLSDFVRDIVAKSTYSKHLGLVSTIRRDFNDLTGIMREEQKRRYQDKSEEINESNSFHVDRIILYIDDLDRCPENKVVDVLQAIHLLLSFELFVVVLAVDERWVSNSLILQYPNLLDESKINKSDKPDNRLTASNRAKSCDYLEKIFQIPYWVKQMDGNNRKQLIDDLVVADAANNGGGNADSSNKKQPEQSEQPGVESDAEPETVGSSDTVADLPRGNANKPETENKHVDEPSAKQLELTTAEVESIKALSDIFAVSPRRTKRFINCYRLIKASLTADVANGFVGKEGEADGYKAVLLLLSIFTRSPALGNYFEALIKAESGSNKRKGEEENKDIPEFSEEILNDWKTVSETVGKWHRYWRSKKFMAILDKWVGMVKRFSFSVVPQIEKQDLELKRQGAPNKA